MNGQIIVSKLVAEFKLRRDQQSTTPDWKLFLEESIGDLIALSDRIDQSEAHQKLSYEELKAWSVLVELRESTMKAILDSSTDMILTLNHSGHILDFNHVAEKKLGLVNAEVSGKLVFDILKPSPFFNALIELLKEENDAVKFKDSFKFQTQISGAHDRLFQAEVSITRFKIGQDYTYAFYIFDQTDELKIKSDLDHIREQATHNSKMASLGEMAAGVAHEINNPLTIITLACEILNKASQKNALDKPLALEAIKSISQTVERIAKIIKGLKTFSRQKSATEFSEVLVDELISDTLNLCRERFRNNGIDLKFIGDGTKTARCLPVQFSQVLLNLLNNSFDAVESVNDKWVKIEFSETSIQSIFSITDSGAGISPELTEKIMQPFFTTKETGKGTGLGLSISKGIIEIHGGALLLDSQSKNTRFIITLPKSATCDHEGKS